MAPVGGSAKGFWDTKQSRYLIWHVSAIRAGFSLAREVAVDTELEILLEAPAREYEAMRQAALVNVTGLTAAAAQQALDQHHISGPPSPRPPPTRPLLPSFLELASGVRGLEIWVCNSPHAQTTGTPNGCLTPRNTVFLFLPQARWTSTPCFTFHRP